RRRSTIRPCSPVRGRFVSCSIGTSSRTRSSSSSGAYRSPSGCCTSTYCPRGIDLIDCAGRRPCRRPQVGCQEDVMRRALLVPTSVLIAILAGGGQEASERAPVDAGASPASSGTQSAAAAVAGERYVV